DQEVVLANARALAASGVRGPVLYAGTVAVQRAVARIFEGSGIELVVTDNVFPDIDELAVEPVRALVHEEFNRHIVHAPGMARLADLSEWRILPTPGAVLLGAELFADEVGDCLVVDVGGATTDVHSVTDGSPEWTARAIDPEPRAKRTVEGDLGVFVNAHTIAERAWGADGTARLADLAAMPSTDRQRQLTRELCAFAVATAAQRHAGVVIDRYTPTGRRQVVRGRDLTAVQWVVGTGGALTRVPGGREILRSICSGPGTHLLPPPGARILIDRDYCFSALGTLAQAHPDEVRATFRRWAQAEPSRPPDDPTPT
ncbi:MAG TPA: glutamate mutase L, partial [Candidatus Limnocylindrales bacterium]|nr:glutamate mutase L [Candidatus Limnocylindrales bacterium]